MNSMHMLLTKIRELAALAITGETQALRQIHADHLCRAVAAALRNGGDESEIEQLVAAATWAARARTHRIARSEAIVQTGAP